MKIYIPYIRFHIPHSKQERNTYIVCVHGTSLAEQQTFPTCNPAPQYILIERMEQEWGKRK